MSEGGYMHWNSHVDRIEPETKQIIDEGVFVTPASAMYPKIARCGCEFTYVGDVHLCEFHMGYDSAVDAMKTRHLEELRARFGDGQGKEAEG